MNASFGLGWDESVVSRYQEYKHGGSVGDQSLKKRLVQVKCK